MQDFWDADSGSSFDVLDSVPVRFANEPGACRWLSYFKPLLWSVSTRQTARNR